MILHIKTVANSDRIDVKKIDGENYIVRIDKPAVDGKANARVI